MRHVYSETLKININRWEQPRIIILHTHYVGLQYTMRVKEKLDPYLFEHNFRKYCPRKYLPTKRIIEFAASPMVCCKAAREPAALPFVG